MSWLLLAAVLSTICGNWCLILFFMVDFSLKQIRTEGKFRKVQTPCEVQNEICYSSAEMSIDLWGKTQWIMVEYITLCYLQTYLWKSLVSWTPTLPHISNLDPFTDNCLLMTIFVVIFPNTSWNMYCLTREHASTVWRSGPENSVAFLSRKTDVRLPSWLSCISGCSNKQF